tara:strand:- start:591 stop:908 length:318 start_codon:yes stop_codon:yes gene_type:complete
MKTLFASLKEAYDNYLPEADAASSSDEPSLQSSLNSSGSSGPAGETITYDVGDKEGWGVLQLNPKIPIKADEKEIDLGTYLHCGKTNGWATAVTRFACSDSLLIG